MSLPKIKGPTVDSGLCRCCGSIKKCRLLNVEYVWMGQKEIYCDIFMDCFGLLLSNLDGEVEKRLICATCVSRLREASSFRTQVLRCEEKMLKTALHLPIDDCNTEQLKEEIEVKIETDNGSTIEVKPLRNVLEYQDMDDRAYDSDSVKSDDLKRPKKILKRKSKSLKAKLKSKLKKSIKHESQPKRVLRRRDFGDIMPELSEEYLEKPKSRSKQPDEEQKSFLNTATVVENSFVCPFDASFSDYYCVYCRHVFTDPSKLREHTLGHDPATFRSVTNQKKQHQLDVLRVDCRLCPKSVGDVEALKEHLISEHGKAFYSVNVNEFLKYRLTLTNITCTECHASFSFFHALKKHMAEHFGACICDVCGAHYFEERMLIIHLKTHAKVDENFPCKDCGKNFKSRHSRYLHETKTHKKEPAYQCQKCDEVLFSYAQRYRHMIEVHGEQRTYPCEHCDRVYDSRKSLREHNRRFHLKIFKHQCDLCDKRFYLPSRLKEHMSTHTGERNYRCEYCGKSYPRLRGLKVHMQTHSTEKKYSCVLCNASFTQNVNLKNHMKRQHMSLAEGFHEQLDQNM